MYKATIVGKHIKDGLLVVTVEFANNDAIHRETFETSQPYDGWIEEQVQRKLVHMDKLPVHYDLVEQGKVIEVINHKVEQISNSEDKAEYQADLTKFTKFVSALARGFTTQENEDFKVLKKKLTDNFKTEYLDLF
jgi:hypothetical protein